MGENVLVRNGFRVNGGVEWKRPGRCANTVDPRPNHYEAGVAVTERSASGEA